MTRGSPTLPALASDGIATLADDLLRRHGGGEVNGLHEDAFRFRL